MKHLKDIVIPLITPITDKDTVDIPSLESLTDYLISKGVDCLYPCGTTGEMVFLTTEERKLVVETVVNTARGRVPVFAQIGSYNTASTIELAQHAQRIGADGIGVVTPWFYKLSDDALIDYFCEVSSRVPESFPIYMYAIPQNAINDINYTVAQAVASKCLNVIGIKYSYPDFTRIQQLMNVRDGKYDVLVGPDHLYEAVFAVGGKGVVSGNAMIIPEHYVAIRDAMRSQNWKLATKIQRRTNMINSILCAHNNISCYKVILKELGIINSAKMRKPLNEISSQESAELIAALREINFQKVLL